MRNHRPSPPMIVALIALFVALGGTGYAALKLPKNSVGPKQIKPDAVTSSKVKSHSLRANDFKAGQLPAGPKGDTGAPGEKGNDGAPGQPGQPGRSALDQLHSGETIHGAWALEGDPTGGSTQMTGVTLPVPAPAAVDSLHAVTAGNEGPTGSNCAGTPANPTAGPGFVCIYFGHSQGVTEAYGLGANATGGNAGATGDGSPFGFVIALTGSMDFTANGTWAYTAP
jgi:hypothetical protein